MQTFIPEARSFAASVAVLDRARLGKQRVETLQIMSCLTGLNPHTLEPRKPSGWVNHPATRMWRASLGALYEYQVATCQEWTEVRGYLDTCLAKTEAVLREHERREGVSRSAEPAWWGDPRVHDSHRANLVRKDPERYLQLWPTVVPVDGYFWPA